MAVSSPHVLQEPEYEPIEYIGRSIHLNDYEESLITGKLKLRKIDKKSYCSPQLIGRFVVWFGACSNPRKHDWSAVNSAVCCFDCHL